MTELQSIDYKDWFINQKRIPDKESAEHKDFFNFLFYCAGMQVFSFASMLGLSWSRYGLVFQKKSPVSISHGGHES
ncbi:MAG: hypothetical protein EBZ89_12235 [Chloroflexi bacterium]|nr:hypothetical protein [Chloroflexota bacterium]